MSSVLDWSKMNPELIDLIMQRLDLIEFIWAGAVCQSWYSIMKSCRYISPPKYHTPWLILSSTYQPEFGYVSNSAYKFNLPNRKHHYIVGSSHGFIISIDEFFQPHATNPITGSHRLLPSITTLPFRLSTPRDPITNKIPSYLFRALPIFFRKIALFPTSLSAGLISVIIYDYFGELAFAGESDESWTCIKSPINSFEDVIFYKGLLYAVNWRGFLVAFDILNFSASSAPVIYVDYWDARSITFGDKYIVQSPCGSDLFLIAKFTEFNTHLEADDGCVPFETVGFKTYKLNQEDGRCQWSEVSSFGTDPVSVFLGSNPSIILLAKDIPGTPLNKGDCIYFTDDEFNNVVHHKQQEELDMGIFYMGPLDMTNHDLQEFNYLPPFWFTPVNE